MNQSHSESKTQKSVISSCKTHLTTKGLSFPWTLKQLGSTLAMGICSVYLFVMTATEQRISLQIVLMNDLKNCFKRCFGRSE